MWRRLFPDDFFGGAPSITNQNLTCVLIRAQPYFGTWLPENGWKAAAFFGEFRSFTLGRIRPIV
jgi:hypothetical protein